MSDASRFSSWLFPVMACDRWACRARRLLNLCHDSIISRRCMCEDKRQESNTKEVNTSIPHPLLLVQIIQAPERLPTRRSVMVANAVASQGNRLVPLLLPPVYSIPTFTRNNLDLLRTHVLARLHLEHRGFDDESPYVVTQAVRVEVALIVNRTRVRVCQKAAHA